ncbi:MAG: ATP phosphoribosyltransferase, partial [Synergistaceae bacterium]|nr:ATP phosphoribosyltransferase [Synergistaceae bacterium]
MINIALPKGRLGEKVYKLFESAGYEFPGMLDKGRKLVFENEALDMRCFWVKPFDVPVYVERGTADIGAAGKDILMERSPDV